MTTKSLSNEQAAAPFDFYDFKKALTKQYGAMYAEMFARTMQEQAGEILTLASRFEKLVSWCDNEIRTAARVVNSFCPADKTTDYTQAQAKIWREELQHVAELVYFRGLLMDCRTTSKQRENIEYTLNKLYGVKYSEYLGDYV